MTELDKEREERVHAMFESLRSLHVEVSDDFIDRLIARARREGQFRGPSVGRIAGGLLSQLANLAVGTVRRDTEPDDKSETEREED